MVQTDLIVEDDRNIRTVMADPPWASARGGGQSTRGAQRHYDLLGRREIVHAIQYDCPAWGRLAESAHLYLWTTNAALADGSAHFVSRRLGFEPKTLITWAKKTESGADDIGLGQYFRHCTEQVLFCRRGEYMETGAKHTTLLEAETGAHSERPAKIYDIIEDSSPGAYLELFARRGRPGWNSWGDQLD